MIKTLRIFALTIGTAFTGMAAPSADEVEFVGFSTALTSPDIGIYGLHQICDREFSRVDQTGQSRMCLSKEIVTTFNTPTPLPASKLGWVQPVLTGLTEDRGADKKLVYDSLAIETYAGELARTRNGTLNCVSWSSSSENNEGLVFSTVSTAGGNLARLNCSNPAHVACCKIVP